MRYSKLMLAVVLGTCMHMAGAVPTPEEAAQLGTTLTPIGAIKAGNKEGTIPEWTPICTPPAGYTPHNGLAAGGAPYIDPYAADKPLFKITAADVAKYADKLDEGTKELFRRYPKTFYVSVYPSHRPACNPEYMYKNTIKNVMRPRIVGGSVPSLADAHAQVPFPIPKTGVEVLWNLLLNPVLNIYSMDVATILVDASGHSTFINQVGVIQKTPYWDNSLTMVPDDQPNRLTLSEHMYPSSEVGTISLRWQYARADQKGAPAWSYIPGQRRVRMAPDFAYDGVMATSAGTLLYDEINGWDGKMDRFDFKLIGRKEYYVPYNNHESQLAPYSINTPNHIDPAALRFELHRVWVVEGVLKPGERHVEKKKVFYIDEDSWTIRLYNGIDHAGGVHHLFHYASRQKYDKLQVSHIAYFAYDLSKRIYTNSTFVGKGPVREMWDTQKVTKPLDPSLFTPNGMVGQGVR